jgi:hypothetical protein
MQGEIGGGLTVPSHGATQMSILMSTHRPPPPVTKIGSKLSIHFRT